MTAYTAAEPTAPSVWAQVAAHRHNEAASVLAASVLLFESLHWLAATLRDLAADAGGVTGDELLAFIAQEHIPRPDGSYGAGLFAYLHGSESVLKTDSSTRANPRTPR